MSSLGSRAFHLDVSAYVLRGTMVDTGCPRVGDGVLDAARSLQVNGAIATHWHEDHAGNVAALATAGIPIWLAAATESTLRHPPDQRLYRQICWGRLRPLPSRFERLELGEMECIHTPGHSKDHHVVWDRETGTLFTGDLWLGVRARIVHASEDPYQIVESLERVRALEPARMFDAHRGPVRDPVGALSAKIEWLSVTLGEIERCAADGMPDSAIVKRVLGGEEMAAYLSSGEYSRRNLVAAVRRHVADG